MEKTFRFKMLVLLVGFLFSSTVNAMTNVVVQNKMSHELLIDSFMTSGSVVFNSSELIGNSLMNADSRAIQIGITSSECKEDENYVVLGVFNNNDQEYEPVILTWGDTGVHISGEYVIDGFYRVSQKADGSSIIITFYDDESSVRQMLINEANSRLKINSSSQQKGSEMTILRYSGLKLSEFNHNSNLL